MIPQIIHQIFIKFKDGKDLNQIPEFLYSQTKIKEWCDKNKYEYKLWDEVEVFDLIREYYSKRIISLQDGMMINKNYPISHVWDQRLDRRSLRK